MRLVLASASPARRRILTDAGLSFDTIPAQVDERALRNTMLADGVGTADIAANLAREKALSVSAQVPDALVIGADQILLHEGRILEKAPMRAQAAQTLRTLSGKTHCLISAVCVVQDAALLWSHTDRADLTMRVLNESLIDDYMRAAGEDVLTGCVGAYAIEGLGLWLFEEIKGNFFTILGLPTLPLLTFLSGRGFGP